MSTASLPPAAPRSTARRWLQLLGFLGVDDDDALHTSGVRFQSQLRSAAEGAPGLLATG